MHLWCQSALSFKYMHGEFPPRRLASESSERWLTRRRRFMWFQNIFILSDGVTVLFSVTDSTWLMVFEGKLLREISFWCSDQLCFSRNKCWRFITMVLVAVLYTNGCWHRLLQLKQWLKKNQKRMKRQRLVSRLSIICNKICFVKLYSYWGNELYHRKVSGTSLWV